jgi:hypothetical protein
VKPTVEETIIELREVARSGKGYTVRRIAGQAADYLTALVSPQAQDAERTLREFVGWLSGDIPELHHVEVPRLAASLERFLAVRASASRAPVPSPPKPPK